MELSAELFEATLHRIKGDGGTGGVERRTTPRVGLRCAVKLLPVKNGTMGAGIAVWTRDISRSGIGVMSSKRMKPGDHFVLTLASTETKSTVVLYCTVRNCEALVRGIFAIGLSFEALRGSEGTDRFGHGSNQPAPETARKPALAVA
jgi:hypothetical protein